MKMNYFLCKLCNREMGGVPSRFFCFRLILSDSGAFGRVFRETVRRQLLE